MEKRMDTEDSLRQSLCDLEGRLLQRDVRHSAGELAKLLAEEFVEIGSTGRLYDKQSIIETLRVESTVHISMSDFKALILSRDVVLVTYRAIIVDREGEPAKQSVRSSIWKLTGGTWQMVFHQGTPTSAP